MSQVERALEANQGSVEELIAAAMATGDNWTTPRAPGKWSPAQVVEHVALSLDEAAHVAVGKPSKFPTIPGFVRPLMRGIFFRRILRKNAFPKLKTPGPFNPDAGPNTPADGEQRLRTALQHFQECCRSRAESGQPVRSGVFGTVSVEDYVRFQELHTRHHCLQIPQPTAASVP